MMSEWHLPPGYIVDNWTDELLALMVGKLAERMKRMGSDTPSLPDAGGRRVGDAQLFNIMGKNVKVIQRNGN